MRTGILEAALDPEGLSTTARAVPAASLHNRGTADYERHRPETTALYELVRDNLETLYGAIADGAEVDGPGRQAGR